MPDERSDDYNKNANKKVSMNYSLSEKISPEDDCLSLEGIIIVKKLQFIQLIGSCDVSPRLEVSAEFSLRRIVLRQCRNA